MVRSSVDLPEPSAITSVELTLRDGEAQSLTAGDVAPS